MLIKRPIKNIARATSGFGAKYVSNAVNQLTGADAGIKRKKMLNERRRKFCDLFANNKDRVQSYMEIWPKCKKKSSASAAASRLLRDKDVRDYLAALEQGATEQAIKKAAISKKRILDEESTIAFSDPKKMLDELGQIRNLEDMPIEMRRAIKSIETKIDPASGLKYINKILFWDKGKSLERLQKCLQMYKGDEQEGEDGKSLTFRLIIQSIDGKNRGKLPQES